MSTGCDFDDCWERSCEFCIVVGPVTRTVSILAYCMLYNASFICSNLIGLKVKWDEHPHNGPLSLCLRINLFSSEFIGCCNDIETFHTVDIEVVFTCEVHSEMLLGEMNCVPYSYRKI